MKYIPLLLVGLLAPAFTFAAAIHDPFPDAIYCSDTTDGFQGPAYIAYENDVTDNVIYTISGPSNAWAFNRTTGDQDLVNFPNSGTWDCDGLTLDQIRAATTTSPRAIGFGYATTTIVAVGGSGMNKNEQLLAASLIMFFLGTLAWPKILALA